MNRALQIRQPAAGTPWWGGDRPHPPLLAPSEAPCSPDAASLLQAQGLRKCFGEAGLRCADLAVGRGEIHALVGANGSGKTTLAGLLAGLHPPDAGTILVEGRPVRFASPRQALAHGIVGIPQEPQLVPELSIADNIFLGDELLHGRLPLLREQRMHRRALELLARLGAQLDPGMPAGRLSLGQQQLVAIAKALHHNPRLCILDEPTAALGAAEAELLFAVLRALRDGGGGVLYISHRLDEVLALADTVTVLREGRTRATLRAAETSGAALIALMVGPERPVAMAAPQHPSRIGPVALRVEELTRRPAFEGVSFQIAAGEIYGLAGIAGSGRTELARGIFGAEVPEAGRVLLYGRPLRIRTPRDATRAGIGLLPEDRRAEGLILCLSGRENVALTIWARIGRGGLVLPSVGLRMAGGLIAGLGLRGPAAGRAVSTLSGGNQQKIMLARWLATLPKVLLFDEPTRGIDPTARPEIHALIRHVAAQGMAVLLISSELPELLALSDRIGVLRRGRLVAELPRQDATQELLLCHALGETALAPTPVGSRIAPISEPC